VIADVVLLAFKLRSSDDANPEKSGRFSGLKLASCFSGAYAPGPTAEGVGAAPNTDTRLERVVMVMVSDQCGDDA
jgi:hypothetical protein